MAASATAAVTGIINAQIALTQLCKHVEGIRSVTVTDADGVVVLQAPPELEEDHNSEQMLTTMFSYTSEQTSKIDELGPANFIMTMYDNCMCLQANDMPLVIRILAEETANAGALIELLPQIKAVLASTRDVIRQETHQGDY